MARKYDCLVRFYASWFADLTNEEKGFTFEEIGQILLKIAEAEIKGDASIVKELPVTIKRGLQMATLEEQIERIIERAQNCKERGSRGGTTTAQRYSTGDREAIEEREKRLKVERELEESKNERHRKFEAHRVWAIKELAKIKGIEVEQLKDAPTTWEEFRKVWELDQRKDGLDFPDWLVYMRFFKTEEAQRIYKDLLRTHEKEETQEEKQ